MTDNPNDVRLPDAWQTYPPIVPLSQASGLIVMPPINYSVTAPHGDPRAALAAYYDQTLPDWLTDDGVGGVADLMNVQQHVALASTALEGMLHDFLRATPPPHERYRRIVIATRLVSYGAHQVSAAFKMHLSRSPFYQTSVLSLVRTAIEVVARGGWVAIGEGNEPDRVVYGPRLPPGPPYGRRIREVAANDCVTAIAAKADRAWHGCDRPEVVYRYLCGFLHFDGGVVDMLGESEERRERLRLDAYASLAYVAWLAAAMGGVIVGQETGLRAPRLPAAPPWR